MPDTNGTTVRHAVGTSGQSPEAGLARDLSELAREMHGDRSLRSILSRISTAAVMEIDAAEYAGISEITGKRISTRAATGPVVEAVDDAQYRMQEGPCVQSLRDQVTVRSDDLATEERWSTFASTAVDFGIRSMLSVQLYVAGDNLGALNLYASTPHAFVEADESTAMLLASHAAIAMAGTKVESNLRIALDSRDVIGQGKGILMERYKISAAEAFDLLVMTSQRTHRKLRDVADELTATGELRLD